MHVKLIAELPEFDTGQYEGNEFLCAGGDARLTIKFSELPPFEIRFHRARGYQFTAFHNCDADMIQGAYFRLIEIGDSKALSAFISSDRAPIKADRELHHYRIFLDESGCYEVFAESASAKTSIDALT